MWVAAYQAMQGFGFITPDDGSEVGGRHMGGAAYGGARPF
jgi:hypothetical protein